VTANEEFLTQRQRTNSRLFITIQLCAVRLYGRFLIEKDRKDSCECRLSDFSCPGNQLVEHFDLNDR
jgi:hypothetical protein